MLAIVFNLLNLLQLTWVFRLYRDSPYRDVALIVIVCLLCLLGYYAASLYGQTRDRLKALPDDSAEAQTLLRISYAGYRLYLVGLGLSFAILAFFNLIRRG